MKRTAIPHTPIADIKNVAHDTECRSLHLNRCLEVYAVVCGCRLNVHRPARVDVACVYIQRKDEVLLGRATIGRDHCVQKECTRTEVDNGRASDAEGIKFGAYEIVCGNRIAHVSLPDDAPLLASSA